MAKVLAGDPQGRVARDGQNAPPNFADQLEMYDALNTVDPRSLTERASPASTSRRPSTCPPARSCGSSRRAQASGSPGTPTACPHVKGATRADVAFAAGYAGTHDRMFLQDVLRHAGLSARPSSSDPRMPTSRWTRNSCAAPSFGQPVASPYSQTYCGGGSLARCRSDLRASLERAVARVLADQGRSSLDAVTYDKHQDDIRHVAAGLVGVRPIDWQNRPTFQQVVDFRGHR